LQNLDYGVVGNGRSAALISRTGSMDWCCLPSFDSRSVFAKLLDAERGGSFSVEPTGAYEVSQGYLEKTNLLVTTFESDGDAFELIDFMPRYKAAQIGYHCPPDVVRVLRPLRGHPRVRLQYDPRPGYARHPVVTEIMGDYVKSYTAGRPYESVYLYSNFDLQDVVDGNEVAVDKERFLYLSYDQKLEPLNRYKVSLELERTKVYWMAWAMESPFYGKYHEIIERSALVLKLLAYQKTGAVVAAVTTSLPESLGDGRNWDYRFCWLRDASMIIRVFTDLRHYNVGRRYLQFILDMIAYKDEKVQIMYGINGEKELLESELDWLEGYEGSSPVRVGNAAYTQRQNDIYGLVMDTIFHKLSVRHVSIENREELWTVVRTLARHVKHNWQDMDSGIWEIRGEKAHWVFSKVLCWVAIDRAVKIAILLRRNEYVPEWSQLRAEIHDDVMTKGYNEELGAFTQTYGNHTLDAANLLLESYGFIDAHDPAYVSTVRKTYEQLCENGLMYRYRNPDDFGVPESSFVVCTFWMIKALYVIGDHELAYEMFDNILHHANHLGLFSEDMDFETGRLLGNFPQGYSHLALIDTAITLLGEQPPLP